MYQALMTSIDKLHFFNNSVLSSVSFFKIKPDLVQVDKLYALREFLTDNEIKLTVEGLDIIFTDTSKGTTDKFARSTITF